MILSLQLLIVFCNKQEKNNVRSGGDHLKHTHTAIFRDRILVRMEHILTGVGVGKFQDMPFSRPQGNDIRFQGGGEGAPGGINLEQIGMNVKRRRCIKFDHIQQIQAHELVLIDRDGMV